MPAQPMPPASGFPWRSCLTGLASTAALASRIAERLRGGEVLLLFGPLGAGKTCLVQGICRALGVRDEVTSPSFTLANRYQGRLVVHHLDFYRVGLQDDLVDIGVDEVLDEVDAGTAVLLAEWPDRLVPLVLRRLELLVLPGRKPTQRVWHLRGFPELAQRWRGLLVEDEPC